MLLDPSLLVRAENATFNAAAESSPMLQCNDIRHCRTLQSIIFGCFSTVFLCTWTALHLNVPYPPLLKRVGRMMIALFAPELVFMEAFEDWTNSSNLLKTILKNYPECGWTQTHAQFVKMGGFHLVDANEETFLRCVEDGTIDLPKVSKDTIPGWSKQDLIAKSITHSLLTQLEITTLGHTLINFFIYFFWWHKPLGVAVPIEVPYKERAGSLDVDDNNQVAQTREIPTQSPPIFNYDTSRASEISLPAATKSNNEKSPSVAPSMSPRFSWYTRLGMKTFSVSEPEQLSIVGRIVLSTIWFIVGGAFGAMHCLAWNSAFPTRTEQLIWRVSSLIVTVIGGIIQLITINEAEFFSSFDEGTGGPQSLILFLVLLPIYCFARISLLVLALLQLRALPYAGYETPPWTIFYPHIG